MINVGRVVTQTIDAPRLVFRSQFYSSRQFLPEYLSSTNCTWNKLTTEKAIHLEFIHKAIVKCHFGPVKNAQLLSKCEWEWERDKWKKQIRPWIIYLTIVFLLSQIQTRSTDSRQWIIEIRTEYIECKFVQIKRTLRAACERMPWEWNCIWNKWIK